ncbi:MAG TPA: 6,7-dimethyl-8-ribityllumazine synthase [Candidatus Limnocylindrales bacterium]|nr:6,7-dimethyl-8-ribityllumazine synthase [Candidatus Limnocylindrales bacterium]
MSTDQPRIAIVVSRFNRAVTNNLLEGALQAVRERGLSTTDDDVFGVPGAFELPLVALEAAQSDLYDAVVCLGAVIRGETPHFDYVCEQAAAGIQQAGLATGKPIAFGVLTTDDMEQALARAGGDVGNKGYEAVVAVLETLEVLMRIRSAASLHDDDDR